MKKIFNVTLAVEAETDKELQFLTDLAVNFKAECDEAKVRVLEIVEDFEVEI